MKPNEFRIFLSSTFRDLMPEREQLVKKVFPQIRALCRERGVEFTEIDLRWGITDEEAHSGKTVRICLEEIDRCPYFLGIIGRRYGWTPGESLTQQDAALIEEYPWIGHYAKENKSITDIEFSHGAILKRKREFSNIYEEAIERTAADSEAIADLKSRITSAGIPLHTFSSPQELGEKVLRDLTAILDRDWPAKKEMSPAERERAAHEAFAFNRTRSYIANPEYYERFEEFVDSSVPSESSETRNPNPEPRPSRPLILWGKSGFGKSALMSHLTSEYKQRHLEAFVVRHFVGATAGGCSSDDVIRHIMLEIREKYAPEDELPQSNLQEELPVWLAKIPEGGKMILAIDAVNQLTGIGPEMHWLPEYIPPSVRLILSTTPELPLEQLRKRNWQEMEILPLTSTQKIRITKEFLARYHKTLPQEQLEVLAEEPKLESPLFLRTLLEELRIFGSHSALEMHLASYLGSQSEAELFQRVLARMERDYSVETVRSIMSAIWASRYGLSETELIEITGLSRLALSEFLIALEFHLMQRSGLFTFFHNYLRQAVETRYIASPTEKQEIHRHLAAYFSEEPYNERRCNEEPWQWQQAEDAEKFKQCITDIPMLEMLLDESRLQEIIGYWVELQKNFDLAQTYHEAMEKFKESSNDEEQFAELSGKLGNVLVSTSHYKEAEYYLLNGLDLRKKLLGDNDLRTVQSISDLSVLYYHIGNFTKAEALLKEVIDIRKKTAVKNDIAIAKALNDLGAIFYSQGKLDEAELCFLDALKLYQMSTINCHTEMASTLCNIGVISYFKKNYDHAISYSNKSIAIYEQIHGTSNIAIIPAIGNLAMAFLETRDYDKAESLFLRALALNKSIYGNLHNETSNTFVNLGVFYSRINEFSKAIAMHHEALEIKKILLGESSFETINSYLSIGMNLFRNGEIQEGVSLIEHYLPLQKKILGENHQMYKVQAEAWKELIKDSF